MKLKDRLITMMAVHRRRVLIGAGCLAGVPLLVFGSLFLYHLLVDPPVPVVEVATAKEIVEFLGHERGFARQDPWERRQFLRSVLTKRAPAGSPFRREFVRQLRAAPMPERIQAREAVAQLVVTVVMEEAEQYNSLPPGRKKERLDNLIDELTALQKGLQGASSAENVLAALPQGDLPSVHDADGILKAVNSRTTPDQRARAAPMVEDYQKRLQARQREGRFRTLREGISQADQRGGRAQTAIR